MAAVVQRGNDGLKIGFEPSDKPSVIVDNQDPQQGTPLENSDPSDGPDASHGPWTSGPKLACFPVGLFISRNNLFRFTPQRADHVSDIKSFVIQQPGPQTHTVSLSDVGKEMVRRLDKGSGVACRHGDDGVATLPKVLRE